MRNPQQGSNNGGHSESEKRVGFERRAKTDESVLCLKRKSDLSKNTSQPAPRETSAYSTGPKSIDKTHGNFGHQ